MPDDAKLGLLAGVVGVVAAAVLYFPKPEPTAAILPPVTVPSRVQPAEPAAEPPPRSDVPASLTGVSGFSRLD